MRIFTTLTFLLTVACASAAATGPARIDPSSAGQTPPPAPTQTPPPPDPAAPSSQTPAQPARPQPPTEYIVGPDDVLQILVYNEREISTNYQVGSDGSIEFPLIGQVIVGGMTVRAIEDHLTKLLAAGYLKNPQVTVTVATFRSQNVFILGEVRNPGRFTLSGNMTLLQALAQAGSATTNASDEVKIYRPKDPTQATAIVPDETGKADASEEITVNIQDLRSGVAQTYQIHDGDTIFVPKARNFYVTGQVRSPGTFVWQRGMTVLQALALAGGVGERGAAGRIKIIRLVGGRRKEIGVEQTDLVEPGDTVYVPQRFF